MRIELALQNLYSDPILRDIDDIVINFNLQCLKFLYARVIIDGNIWDMVNGQIVMSPRLAKSNKTNNVPDDRAEIVEILTSRYMFAHIVYYLLREVEN